ncbi:MAG: glutamine--scyllo-inositol aminotransferase [Verrucomicrobia bacterium]|nr:MAG: glutamine--scyllo-inositol aminotransferase [Verrucomicrobiota bacterium]
MKATNGFTRREFIAGTSALLLAGELGGQETKTPQVSADADKLAMEGGEKAVKKGAAKAVRWGEPERGQLGEMLKQDSLLYWKAPQTTLLIQRFKEHCPLEHVMTCSSGTAALHIAVAAAGIAPGDEVITSSFTDIGTVIGILFQQAVPVFADLEPFTYHVSTRTVAPLITARTKAIIAVHLGGNPSELKELRALADKHNLVLIEDCAQAWGALYQGKPIGTIGHLACFSLQTSKHITCGDGGIVASSDERFGPLLQRFGDKGFDRGIPKFLTERLGTNYRMSEPQAAFAAAQMNRLEDIAAKRGHLGDLLTSELAGTSGISTPKVAEKSRCTYWHYMLRVRPDKLRCPRAQFVKAAAAEGVPLSNGYIPLLLHQLPMFQKHAFFAGRWPVKELGLTTMDYTKVKLPEAEAILDTCAITPITEAMDEEYVRSVAKGIRKVAKHYSV